MTDQSQESKDQAHEQSSDQPADLNSNEQSQQEDSGLYEFAGRKLTADELYEEAVKLNKDYTKKTQELSRVKKAFVSDEDVLDDAQQEVNEVESQLDQLAELLGPRLQGQFVSKQDKELNDFMASNPDLEKQKKTIEALGNLPENKQKSYWDIAQEYGLKSSDKLQEAKESRGDLTGRHILDKKPVSNEVPDYGTKEWDEWKKKNLGKKDKWKSIDKV